MYWKVFYMLIISVTLMFCTGDKLSNNSITWKIDNFNKVGSFSATVLSSPAIIETELGRALQFDGADDALIVEENPIAGWGAFTIEVIFRPDSGGNTEQRFLHFQEVDSHRVLIETRLTENCKWFLDTYMKYGNSDKTLYAKNYLHDLDQWYHAALTYDGTNMAHYVNGMLELSGSVKFNPMNGGEASIGCRINRVYWFKGAIILIKFTPFALPQEEFGLLKMLKE